MVKTYIWPPTSLHFNDMLQNKSQREGNLQKELLMAEKLKMTFIIPAIQFSIIFLNQEGS